jgi:hypothetical protein
MDATHAEELLRKMERQILDQLCANEMAQEPEREIHSDEAHRGERQRNLQERLNEICSLRDLFTQQSHTIALLKQPQPSRGDLPPVGETLTLQPTEVSDFTDFSSNSLADNGDLQEESDTPYVTPTKTLDETLEEITNTLDQSLRDTLNETSPTSVLQFDSRLRKDDIAHSTYEEDDESFQLDFDGTDSEIQDAINEIRKEASRMDILMALDQVHTVQSELSVVTKALHERSTEAEDLRLQLEEGEERMSFLELERDLFKADASKVRDDLETCVARMFDISLVAGQSSLEPDVTRDRPAERQSQEVFRKHDEPSRGLKANGRSQKTPTVPVMLKASKHPLPMHPPMTRLAEVNESTRTLPGVPTGLSQRSNFPTIESRCPDENVNSQLSVNPDESRKILRRRSSHSDPSGGSRATRVELRPSVPNTMHTNYIFREGYQQPVSDSVRPAARTRAPVQRRRCKSESIENRYPEPESEEKENRMCGIFRRRHHHRQSSSKEQDIALMKEQIDQMQEMMKSSLTASEKLRKRLAMISRYYESIIQKNQEKMAHMKNEKRRMEGDLINQISSIDHEKRVAIIKLESKLRQKEEEIAALKRFSI